MDTREEQVGNFLNRCDDLMQSKFILAPSKISDLLRSIAAAPALVALFEKATKPFDYLEAQKQYMLPSPDGTVNKGAIFLPDDPMERLAFIFCLLVDIDNQVLNFNLFLQTFFAEDGSYTEAFELFCSQILRPLKSAVCEQLNPAPAERPQTKPIEPKPYIETQNAQSPLQAQTSVQQTQNKEKTEKHGKHNKKATCNAMLPIIKTEIAAVQTSALSEPDRYAGVTILNEMQDAAKTADEKALKALLLGYNYFVVYTGKDDVNATKMFNIAEEL